MGKPWMKQIRLGDIGSIGVRPLLSRSSIYTWLPVIFLIGTLISRCSTKGRNAVCSCFSFRRWQTVGDLIRWILGKQWNHPHKVQLPTIPMTPDIFHLFHPISTLSNLRNIVRILDFMGVYYWYQAEPKKLGGWPIQTWGKLVTLNHGNPPQKHQKTAPKWCVSSAKNKGFSSE